ncbi:HAAS signaling domain-containing protein [Amycolatopsis sp. H20-H5]|uniref:HAAS signaling domain-containing protein n=1 Tax=Amycolatopsis sp. H20-H5 TaxID=3046309 RepID=UPI002DBCC8B8|nr:hypothetical protein [Amycolatopsis sp. H20-H5]MEC3973702.1 hypothetical protein [Amycolatopsis sp. H20-H5]
MSTQNPTAVRVYLARVRTALADLPDSEVEEILEDVRPHLAEMESELGEGAKVEGLIDKLGTPESYAAELRSSGGYPPRADDPAVVVAAKAGSPGRKGPRFAFWGLAFCCLGIAMFAFASASSMQPGVLMGVVLFLPVLAGTIWYVMTRGVRPVAELPEVVKLKGFLDQANDNHNGKVITYLRSLKPAWWILCAFALVGFGLFMLLGHSYAAVLLPVMLAAAVLIVWVGTRIATERRLLWLAVPISAFVVGIVFGGLGKATEVMARSGPSYYPGSSYPAGYQDSYGNSQLTYGSSSIDNVYAFDAEGKPIPEVYLYDERGRPLSTTRYVCEKSSGGRQKVGEDNRYPRPNIEEGVTDDQGNFNGYNGYRGSCRENANVPFSAAIPKGAKVSPSSPSASPSATPLPSPSPSTTAAQPTR